MKQWRVGTISMGILMILFGVLLLGNTIWDIHIADILVYAWPIILILLGVEVLLFSLLKKESKLRFDFFSIFILFLALSFTFVVYSVQETGILSSFRSAVYNESYTLDVNKNLNIPAEVKEVVIDSPNGSFDLVGDDTESLNVTGTIRLSADSEEEAADYLNKVLEVKVLGDQAIVRVDDVRQNHFFGNNTLKSNLVIHLPKDRMVKVKLVNGDIEATGLEGSGSIESVNGTISYENGKGNYDIQTINGKVYVKNQIGDVNVHALNGKVYAEEIEGNVSLDTQNGKIYIKTSKVTGDWDVSATNGEISLEIPNNINAKVKAETSIGEVKGNLNWQSTDSNDIAKLGSKKTAVLGDGKYTIELSSTHGEVEVVVE